MLHVLRASHRVALHYLKKFCHMSRGIWWIGNVLQFQESSMKSKYLLGREALFNQSIH